MWYINLVDIPATSRAAILLLRDLADKLEKREIVVRSISVGMVTSSSDHSSDPYLSVNDPIPNRIEILTVVPPPFQNNC